jgi:adenylate kinase
VGKGTQAALLVERFGAVHLASGDIFRSELREETELGLLAKSYMEKGELVPDGVTVEMMAKRLIAPEVREKGFILDGFPRSVAQAEALDRLLATFGESLEAAVSLEVPDEIVIQRLSARLVCASCGAVYHRVAHPPKRDSKCDKCSGDVAVRRDDRPETVAERLRVFHEATAPVIRYYETFGLLRKVDGTGTPEEVREAAVRALGE